MKFSANLGFLWQDLPLPDAIRAAKTARFDAVECHWPYAYEASEITGALGETGLQMLGLNSFFGKQGENGLLALVDRRDDARASIDQAIDYAVKIGALNIHMMAGFAQGRAAQSCFAENLDYACMRAKLHGKVILIEPLNDKDAPGYFLQTAPQAADIIHEAKHSHLKLMFDVYHMQFMGGDLTRRLTRYMPIIGHIQIAGHPNRGTPDSGEINYAYVLAHIKSLGWDMPIGAEYKPQGKTEDSLAWLHEFKKI